MMIARVREKQEMFSKRVDDLLEINKEKLLIVFYLIISRKQNLCQNTNKLPILWVLSIFFELIKYLQMNIQRINS